MGWYGENGLEIYCDNGLVAEQDECPCGVNWVVGAYPDRFFISKDGINWVYQGPFSGTPYSMARNPSLWAAASGHISISLDGITWTSVYTPTLGLTHSVAWNGSYWLSAGYYKFATSPDGINWTEYDNPYTGARIISNPVWNGSIWLLTGPNSDTITSSDGLTWTEPVHVYPYPQTKITDAIWMGSLFVVGEGWGKIATSPDGINWTDRTNPLYNFATTFAWNGFLIVAAGISAGKIATSPDGINWTERSSTVVGGQVAWNGSLFVIITSTQIATSPDGINWTERIAPYSGAPRSIASKTAPGLFPPIG